MKQNLIYSSEPLLEQREKIDRRDLSFKSFVNYFYKGRRVKARRQVEIKKGYYTDTYEKCVGWSALSIILLSALDAFFTLNILEKGGTEVNPLMLALLTYDIPVFMIGKMVITISCVLFALVHVNFYVLRLFPMKYMLKSILVFYVFLMCYEIFLLLTI